MRSNRAKGKARLGSSIRALANDTMKPRSFPSEAAMESSLYWLRKIGQKRKLTPEEIHEVQNLEMHSFALQRAMQNGGRDIPPTTATGILLHCQLDAQRRLKSAMLNTGERAFFNRLVAYAEHTIGTLQKRPPQPVAIDGNLLERINEMHQQRIRAIIGNGGYAKYLRAMEKTGRVIAKMHANEASE